MNRASVQEMFLELQSRYRRLSLEDLGEPNGMHIQGILDFSGRGKNELIEDSFEILILVPESFPSLPPSTKEVGGRIPTTFHQFKDGLLCLGAPLYIRMTFFQNPSLLGYIEDLVIPYLFSFCYYRKFGKMPFGELSHGVKGIMEYYRDLFASGDDMVVLDFLKIQAEDSYKGHHNCPCGSGKIIRRCHGDILGRIKYCHCQEQLIDDYRHCLDFVKREYGKVPQSLISSKILRNIEKDKNLFRKK
ncbi:MAG TPA: hypothetical protein DDY59_12695 [Lachnospiraceae bacterium]|nr:hypothetical protein [Lachnospiraceae bacterium]